LQSLTALLP